MAKFLADIWGIFRNNPCRCWLAFFVVANIIFTLPNNTNPQSRYATLCAMTEDHSFCIDHYRDWTVDWARKPDGHYYSNKAPGPMLLGYPIFLVIDKIINPHEPDRSIRDQNRRKYDWLVFNTLSILFQILPFLILVALSLHWLATQGVSCPALHVSCVVMLFGNTATLFMNTYFGHAMAANCVLAACLCFIYQRYAGAGLAYGLALLCDYSSALLLPGFVLTILLRVPASKWLAAAQRIALGAIFPAILWILYHVSCFGSPFTLPSRYQNPEFVDNTGYAILGIFNIAPDPIVAFKLLFGFRRGILWSQPWLLVILAGLLFWRHTIRKISQDAWRAASPLLIFLLPGFVFLWWMNASFHEWHSGCSPGPRYMCSVFPAFGLLVGMLYDGFSKPWRRCIMGTAAFSTLYWILLYSTNHMVPDISLWRHPLEILTKDTPSFNTMARLIILVLFFEWQAIFVWRQCQAKTT